MHKSYSHIHIRKCALLSLHAMHAAIEFAKHDLNDGQMLGAARNVRVFTNPLLFMTTPTTVQCLLLLLLRIAASWQRMIPWACTPTPVTNKTHVAVSTVCGSDYRLVF